MNRTIRCCGLLAALTIGLCASVSLAQEHGAPAHAPAAQAHTDAAPADHAEHAAGGHEPSVFAGSIVNSLFTLLIFVLLLSVLSKYAWKPLINGLDAREKSIRDAIEAAHRQRSEAEVLLRNHQAAIDKARLEASAIVEEGRRDAEATRRRVADEARKEADELITRARREIQLATDGAIKELYDKVADLSVQVAGTIVHKSLSADDHRALVRESIERMSAAHTASRN